jgi:hypothetical protein
MARTALRNGRTSGRGGRSEGSEGGFTLVDALALVVGVSIGGVALLAMSCQSAGKTSGPEGALPAGSRAMSNALKCATQVRGIGQALVIFAQSNKDIYPLPSNFDAENFTVPETGRAKDTTANIMSMMIYTGMISPQLCVCPDEHSTSIGVYMNYEYDKPRAAVNPAMAIWDPAFGADFRTRKGNVSYAHNQPSGDWVDSGSKDKDGAPIKVGAGRLAMWSNTFSASEAILGDRGPEIESVTFTNPKDPATAKVRTKRPESVTFLNHGNPRTWEGNIGYNDNHVNLETTLGPPTSEYASTYLTATGERRFDTWHYDEPDDAEHKNIFLGIFVKAGKTPGEFKGIWD